MHKRILLLIFLLLSGPLFLNAQDDVLKLGLRAGHNAALGGFAAISIEADQTLGKNFSANAGLQYNTIGKLVLEARPAYDIQFIWGKVSIESMLTCTSFGSTNSYTAGAGATVDSRNISGTLGYYYRIFGGQTGWIKEPLNIYYELRGHFLKKIENWNLDIVITNCEIFELERHYQPSFIVEGSYYPKSKIGISFGIGCKPSGMFNMSADYYQSFLKTGVCYRW